MRLLILLLLLLHGLLGVVCGITDRGGTSITPLTMAPKSFRVLPIDYADDTAVEALEAQLRSIVNGKVERHTPRQGVRWTVTLDVQANEDIVNIIAQLPTVRSVKPKKDQSGVRRHRRSDAERRQAAPRPKLYIVSPKDGSNHDKTDAVATFLKQTIINDDYRMDTLVLDDQVLLWTRLNFDAAGLEKARNHPDILAVKEEENMVKHFQPDNASRKARKLGRLQKSAATFSNFAKRAVAWTKQETPKAEDLRVYSQPPGSPIHQLPDFVYEANAGEGTFVYVIDGGVQVDIANDDGDNEFEVNPDSYQTVKARDSGWNEDQDMDEDGHGTQVASKVAGTKMGVAKKTTIQSVQVTKSLTEIFNGLEKAYSLIKERQQRDAGSVSKSVVLMASGGDRQYDHDSALRTPDGQNIRAVAEKIMTLGVPIVYSSGNKGNHPGRQNVDVIPQVLEDDSHPIIVVGATDIYGKRWMENPPVKDGEQGGGSQGGKQVTVYAVGKGAWTLSPGEGDDDDKNDGEEGTNDGTSFAAPVVAGIIANYMSRGADIPWDQTKTGKDRVFEIKRYIRSSASSYVRLTGQNEQYPINVIWNGATLNNHRDAGANWCYSLWNGRSVCYGEPPSAHCYGWSKTNKYITRGTLSSEVVMSKFCPEAALPVHYSARSFSETYLKGTPEEVSLTITWPEGRQPDRDECQHFMHEIINQCDRNNVGLDWKFGGELRDGFHGYKIIPLAERLPSQSEPSGTCDISYKVVLNANTISGRGWMNSGFGHELKQAIEGKGLKITDWDFKYKVVTDTDNPERSYEWIVHFNTPIGGESRIEDAIRQSMAFKQSDGNSKGINCKNHLVSLDGGSFERHG